MSSVRRSQRIRHKSSVISEEDEASNESTSMIQADEQIGYGSEDDESSEEEDQQDEDYEESAGRTKKRKLSSRPSSSSKDSKKARTSITSASMGSSGKARASKKAQEQYLQMLEDFDHTELFEVLCDSEDISVEELANRWLDTYTDDRDKAIQEFINFILNCCGALVQVQEHDVVSNESSNETVGEVQLLFQKQELHEFHLLLSKNNKKKSKHKALYRNFSEFMGKVMELANERGLLYNESSEDGTVEPGSLIMDLLTWLSSFSVCKIRCLRYTATLAMYLFQDYLTELIVDLENSYLVKLRKQLSMEQKKKRTNSKVIDKLQSSIAEIQDSKTIVENCIDNIIKLSFVHRFKDVDETIRTESMIHLAIWLENYPESFFKVTYLKYFGWLLSDSSSNVRLHVLKALLEIVKFNNKRNKHTTSNSAWRQFFERFKQRVLEISLKDIDIQVRLSAVQLLVEINSFGYLENEEILTITSLIFDSHKLKISSTAKNVKFLSAVAKFFAHVEKDEVQQFTNSSKLINDSELNSHDIIEVGLFLRFLVTSLSAHLRNMEEEVSIPERIHLLFQAAEFLQPYFVKLIQPMCDLLAYEGDLDSIKIDGDDEIDQTKLLLPLEENSIIQYVVVLHGLCHGGIDLNKSQNRKDTATAIIPNLEKLFARLSLQSDEVTYHLFGIFQMFDYEDWITNNEETAFTKISETIIKSFVNTQFSNRVDDQKRIAYADIIQYFKKIDLPDINELWKSEESQIKVPFQKYLEFRFDNSENIDWNVTLSGLYDLYMNKLVLLGKVIPLDFSLDFLKLFFSKFVDQLPQALSSLESDIARIIDFKFLTLIVTWNLQSWYEIFEGRQGPTAVSRDVLDENSFIIKQLSNTAIFIKNAATDEASACFHIEWRICSAIADLLTASKMFELKLPAKESEWKEIIKRDYALIVERDLSNVLLGVFLYLESVYAQRKGIQLDRFHDEDVNLNDLDDDTIANVEEELYVYVVKLKSLLKLKLVKDAGIQERIALNKKALGSIYESIIDETAFLHEDHKHSSSHSKPVHDEDENRDLYSKGEVRDRSDERLEIMDSTPHMTEPVDTVVPQGYSSEI